MRSNSSLEAIKKNRFMKWWMLMGCLVNSGEHQHGWHMVHRCSYPGLTAVAEVSSHACESFYVSMLQHIPVVPQGGGGSFKNRKRIGEVGCCESGIAERSHWWSERWLISLTISLFLWLSTYLPTYLSLSLFHLITYLSIFLPIYLSIFLSICLSIYQSFYLSIYRSIYLSTYLSIYLPLSPSSV